jgi:hypothetical protein
MSHAVDMPNEPCRGCTRVEASVEGPSHDIVAAHAHMQTTHRSVMIREHPCDQLQKRWLQRCVLTGCSNGVFGRVARIYTLLAGARASHVQAAHMEEVAAQRHQP